MKALLLATALVAAPVIAQSQSDTSITTQSSTSNSADKVMQDPSTPTAKDMNQPADTSITTRSSVSQTPNSADPAAQQPMPAPADPSAMPPAADPAMAPPATDPNAAAMAPAPGGGVVFQQPQSVSQAFPPPAPKASYPACSRTVRDSCIERGGRK